jgi:predicted  nucleic acid-binding Zn-ribbon protein
LEAVVEKLLAGFNSMKQEKAELEAQLRQRQYEVEELHELVAALKEEKTVVHQRVSGLLNSIEDWEKNQVAV